MTFIDSQFLDFYSVLQDFLAAFTYKLLLICMQLNVHSYAHEYAEERFLKATEEFSFITVQLFYNHYWRILIPLPIKVHVYYKGSIDWRHVSIELWTDTKKNFFSMDYTSNKFF